MLAEFTADAAPLRTERCRRSYTLGEEQTRASEKRRGPGKADRRGRFVAPKLAESSCYNVSHVNPLIGCPGEICGPDPARSQFATGTPQFAAVVARRASLIGCSCFTECPGANRQRVTQRGNSHLADKGSRLQSLNDRTEAKKYTVPAFIQANGVPPRWHSGRSFRRCSPPLGARARCLGPHLPWPWSARVRDPAKVPGL